MTHLKALGWMAIGFLLGCVVTYPLAAPWIAKFTAALWVFGFPTAILYVQWEYRDFPFNQS